MWLCPKCGTGVDDSLELCWICGTSPDGTVYPRLSAVRDGGEASEDPLDFIEIIEVIGKAREKTRPPSIAGVPRRFGLGRLMLLVAFFAVLFGLLSCLDAHPVVFVVVTVFIVMVGLAQAILYSGKQPRRASVVAGAALGALVPTIWFVGFLFVARGARGIGCSLCGLPLLIALCAGVGAGLGYLAGCLIAGVFLGTREGRPKADSDRSGVPDPLSPEDTQIDSPEDPPDG